MLRHLDVFKAKIFGRNFFVEIFLSLRPVGEQHFEEFREEIPEVVKIMIVTKKSEKLTLFVQRYRTVFEGQNLY